MVDRYLPIFYYPSDRENFSDISYKATYIVQNKDKGQPNVIITIKDDSGNTFYPTITNNSNPINIMQIPQGSYLNGTTVFPCPVGKTTTGTGSTDSSQCSIAAPGYYMKGDIAYSCPVDKYCPGTTNLSQNLNYIQSVNNDSLYIIYGIAVDNQGNIYVGNQHTRSLKRMDSNGQNITTLNGNYWPGGVAVDSQGYIYITDLAYNTGVIKMNLSGTVITTLGNGEFSSPWGVAVDSQGYIYVADTGHHSIKRINLDGTVITILDTGLNNPRGVAVDSQGYIYVADTFNHAIKRINSDGSTTTLGNGEFINPINVAVDSQGNIYVADYNKNAIIRMDSNGKNITTLGTGFSSPTCVAVDNQDNIYFCYFNSGNLAPIKRINQSGMIPCPVELPHSSSGSNDVDQCHS